MLYPDAEYAWYGDVDDYAGLDWHSDGDPPPEAELVAARDAEIASWEQTEYARNRAVSYPSIGDQLDALFHAGLFPEEMATQLQAVKDAYPKPEAN